jgi:hypothetical protein
MPVPEVKEAMPLSNTWITSRFCSPLAICLKVVFIRPDKREEKGGGIMIKGRIIRK